METCCLFLNLNTLHLFIRILLTLLIFIDKLQFITSIFHINSVYPGTNNQSLSSLKAYTGLIHIDCAHTVTHCVSICMDNCRFICTVGRSADLCMDVYGDLLLL